MSAFRHVTFTNEEASFKPILNIPGVTLGHVTEERYAMSLCPPMDSIHSEELKQGKN